MYNKLELIWLENKVFLLIYQMLEYLEEKQKVTTKAKKKIGWETVKGKWKDINETIRKKIDDKRTETYNIHKKLKRHRYIEI